MSKLNWQANNVHLQVGFCHPPTFSLLSNTSDHKKKKTCNSSHKTTAPGKFGLAARRLGRKLAINTMYVMMVH
jgi:hypothetical protein